MKQNPIVESLPPSNIPMTIEIIYEIKNIFFWNSNMFFNILRGIFLNYLQRLGYDSVVEI
ncbi:hypothetical protein SB49_10880 [Sediminicola sp. YIK13]|nr:hypothetical protein SB49_10880 [Sediminicola sp. YIK13]